VFTDPAGHLNQHLYQHREYRQRLETIDDYTYQVQASKSTGCTGFARHLRS